MFFLIEVTSGDDNDQSIGDFIIEADNREECGKIIEKLFWDGFTGDREDVTTDGDGDNLYFMWDIFYDENGNEIEKDDLPEDLDDVPYTPFHEDYFISQEYDKLEDAEKDIAKYHSRWADILKD